MSLNHRIPLLLSVFAPLVLAPACDKDEGESENCARVYRGGEWPDGGDTGWPDGGDTGGFPDDGDTWPDGGETGGTPDGDDSGSGGGDGAPMMMGEACPVEGDTAGNGSAGDGSASDGSAGDGSAGDGSASDGSAGDDTAGDPTTGDDSAGDDTAGDDGGKGALGENCTSGDDCEEGKCILTSEDLGFCTRQCVKAEDCPEEGWVCNLAPYTACVPDV